MATKKDYYEVLGVNKNATDGGRLAKYMPFIMNEAFNERPLIKDAELEELNQEEGDTDA